MATMHAKQVQMLWSSVGPQPRKSLRSRPSLSIEYQEAHLDWEVFMTLVMMSILFVVLKLMGRFALRFRVRMRRGLTKKQDIAAMESLKLVQGMAQ